MLTHNFQIVFYYEYGEINLYNLVWKLNSFVNLIFKCLSVLKILQVTVLCGSEIWWYPIHDEIEKVIKETPFVNW